MSEYGYDWEAKQVTTKDNYILTTFYILGHTGKARPATSNASILVQHGAHMDGVDFFGKDVTDNKTFIL